VSLSLRQHKSFESKDRRTPGSCNATGPGAPQRFPGSREREPDSDRGISGSRFLVASTRLTTVTAEASIASQIRE
jgi:hypothetical protein